MEKKLFTLIVYSENIAGLLNQVTAEFTRRQMNIETLNVSSSSIENVHRYTITVFSDEETIQKVTKRIEKKIDVVKADYYTDQEIFMQEVALYKQYMEQNKLPLMELAVDIMWMQLNSNEFLFWCI